MALAKCAHPGCACLPENGMIHCSTTCEVVDEEKLDVPISCACGIGDATLAVRSKALIPSNF